MRRRPKQIPSKQITGQQGVNFVERVILDMGFAWHPSNANLEAGIDGFIEIRNPETGEATNNILQVQVKATTAQWNRETKDQFTYRCDPRDIDYWLQSNTPVILVAVRPEGGEAYWGDVKAFFSDPQRRKDHRIEFNKTTQRFDTSAALDLVGLAVPRDTGPYLPATPQPETLVSNLLEVRRFPPTVFVASTDYRKPSEIFEWARKEHHKLPNGWLLKDKAIKTIYPLQESPWNHICDVATVEQCDLPKWSNTHDTDRRREFVRLMHHVLRDDMHMRGLWYAKHQKAYYFPAGHGLNVQDYAYRSLALKTSRRVVIVARQRETGEIRYCRHAAFKHTFLRIDERWYLAITPTYIYTTDNKTPYAYGEDLLSGMKRMERQQAVLGQVVMWKAKLTEPTTLFRKQHPHIVFGDLLRVHCARGIDDQCWLPGDPFDNAEQEGETNDWGLF